MLFGFNTRESASLLLDGFMAGVLAGRLEPTPALLPRHVSSSETFALRPA
jgi:hypothetical protein